MKMKPLWIAAGAFTVLLLLLAAFAVPAQGKKPAPSPETLGEKLYFDTNLSDPDGQSCANCHEPTVGFDDPDADLPVSEGVVPGLFGGRNSPISAYAMYSPLFDFDEEEELWIGGMFWDGRATGEVYGDPLADQAAGPPLNPVEMANPDKATIIADIQGSDYVNEFIAVCGSGIFADVEAAYDCMAKSIASFERTGLFAQFNSRYDLYLRVCIEMGGEPDECAQGTGDKAGLIGPRLLTSQEWDGLQLFMGENDNDGELEPGEGAFCSACHVAEWTAVVDYELPVVVPDWAPEGMVPPLFTDFTYDNLGMPSNPELLDLIGDPDYIDFGLGAVLSDPAENGKFKVSTLRNIGASAPYGHNGLFSELYDLVHFYNTRDDSEEGWGAPEVPETVNFDELGNLGLSNEDEQALVAFMLTLTDKSIK